MSEYKMLVYDLILNTLTALAETIGEMIPDGHPRKICRFMRGQKRLSKHIKDTYRKDPSKPTVWIHASSFGEYSVARPIISELSRRGMQIVMTFFSPTGYEALRRNPGQVDYIYYLPMDTKRNSRLFLDTIKPDKAVFIVSEYWYNYLSELKRRGIDTCLVSAKINRDSVFFKWYGMLHRKCLDTYRHFFVIDEKSRENLRLLGHDNSSVVGNPLFDNAIEKSQTEWANPEIARLCRGHKVFIAGSIHEDRDLEMVSDLANRHRDVKFLIVPHEISRKTTSNICGRLHGKAIALSKCQPDTDLTGVQTLVVDHVGSLAYIYRYADWAYVGGGFTKYLHSLIEATVYGLPVSFGPETRRKVTPMQIIDRGIGQVVRDSDELDRWLIELQNDPGKCADISRRAKEYVAENAGSTKIIADTIQNPEKNENH